MILANRLFYAFLMVVFMLAFSATALAAPPDKGSKKPGGGSGSTTAEPYGLDVSWPQCGKRLPKDMAFAIVGVNDGLANDTNHCLSDQLLWGSKAVGGTQQAKLQLYVNTANPAGLGTASWPTNNIDVNGSAVTSGYGACNGKFNYDLACSYQYGWNRAVEDDVIRFTPAAKVAKIDYDSSNYIWWLDVETENTWLPSGSEFNQKSNVAVLEGMADYFISIGAEVGVYSNSYQWKEITGNLISDNSSLRGLPDWRPSGDLKTAKFNCDAAAPLTPGGYTALTQYVIKNLDHNYSCQG